MKARTVVESLALPEAKAKTITLSLTPEEVQWLYYHRESAWDDEGVAASVSDKLEVAMDQARATYKTDPDTQRPEPMERNIHAWRRQRQRAA